MQDIAIKKLPKSFTGRGEVGGREFKCIKRYKDVAIYKVSDYYEVIKIKVNSRYNTETYPSSKTFGTLGFLIKDYISANEKYLELIKKSTKDEN